MNLSKIFHKKVILAALAAAGALAAGSASAASAPAQPAPPSTETTLIFGVVNAGTCARAYVMGKQYELKDVHATTVVNKVPINKSFMASVFKGPKCGGATIKNVWYTTSKTSWQVWAIQ